jgi:V/A-type H+-transporting ATPase subunit D
MAGLPLNKSSLKQERNRLATFARFLPSLDLKRRQLAWELRRAERELATEVSKAEELAESSREMLALLGSTEEPVDGLVKVESIEIETENVVGARLPVLAGFEVGVSEYSTLAEPFWIDTLVDTLTATLELRVRKALAEQRVRRLQQAFRRVTQRVNLFEKVLIPEAKQNIKWIEIHLADLDRAAVVRSKITKAKRQRSVFAEPAAG